MELKVKLKSVSVILTSGTDIVRMYLDEPSSFPIMEYDTAIKIECQKDYGIEYCRNVLGLEPEIIDVR